MAAVVYGTRQDFSAENTNMPPFYGRWRRDQKYSARVCVYTLSIPAPFYSWRSRDLKDDAEQTSCAEEDSCVKIEPLKTARVQTHI